MRCWYARVKPRIDPRGPVCLRTLIHSLTHSYRPDDIVGRALYSALPTIMKTSINFASSASNGVVVRALVSHQCGPGLIPGIGVICGLNLLLILVLAP